MLVLYEVHLLVHFDPPPNTYSHSEITLQDLSDLYVPAGALRVLQHEPRLKVSMPHPSLLPVFHSLHCFGLFRSFDPSFAHSNMSTCSILYSHIWNGDASEEQQGNKEISQVKQLE